MIHKDWTFCDGEGNLNSKVHPAPRQAADSAGLKVSRRTALIRLGLGAIGLGLAKSAISQVIVQPGKSAGHTLVVVFLRGGADGLSLVSPLEEEHYFRSRPNLALNKSQLLPIEKRFGMHPALRPLHGIWESGELAIAHAVGSQDSTRSHFEAMRTMEYGVADGSKSASGGWLARYLSSTSSRHSPLRAVCFGGTLPDSLRGSSEALAMSGLQDFRLDVPDIAGSEELWLSELEELYAKPNDVLAEAGHEALKVLKVLREKQSEPAEGGKSRYPESGIGRALKDTATLIRLNIGVEVVALDQGQWDTHVTQGTTSGWIANNMQELSTALAAFWSDLGSLKNQVTVVVQTEFGRRVSENVALGTDHGRASALFVLDSLASGGQVRGAWPGLNPSQLDEVGDLKVANDYRSVLAEVLDKRMAPNASREVFAGASLSPIAMLREKASY